MYIDATLNATLIRHCFNLILTMSENLFEQCTFIMACWRRLHLQFRHRWTSGRTSKSSNGRKIARMARNSTIFGPNESSRRDLFLEKFSKSRNNRKVFEKLRKIFEKFFERCNLMGDVILSNTSLSIFEQFLQIWTTSFQLISLCNLVKT